MMEAKLSSKNENVSLSTNFVVGVYLPKNKKKKIRTKQSRNENKIQIIQLNREIKNKKKKKDFSMFVFG